MNIHDAKALIKAAESHLGYSLRDGQRRDLLMDNSTLDSETVHRYVSLLNSNNPEARND